MPTLDILEGRYRPFIRRLGSMMARSTPPQDPNAGVHYFQKYDHTVMEAAQVLGYSVSTMYRWIRTGKMAAKKIGKQTIVPLPSIIYWKAVGGQRRSI